MTNLQKYRKKQGFTQLQLASMTGLKKNTLALYERGERDINKAAANIVYRLSLALSCHMEDLLEISDIPNITEEWQ